MNIPKNYNLPKIVFLIFFIILMGGCQNGSTAHKKNSIDSTDNRVRNIIIIASSKNDKNSSSQYFSFDSGNSYIENPKLNDIFFGLTSTSMPFLAISPVNLAKGAQVENNQSQYDSQSIIFNKNDCEPEKINYTSGAMPIPSLYSKYCWITNNGNFVEFVVTDITEIIDDFQTYEITLTYVIWEK